MFNAASVSSPGGGRNVLYRANQINELPGQIALDLHDATGDLQNNVGTWARTGTRLAQRRSKAVLSEVRHVRTP
jgi:hypothetical protein